MKFTKGCWEIDGSRPWRSILELNGMTEELKSYPKPPTRRINAETWQVIILMVATAISSGVGTGLGMWMAFRQHGLL